MAIRRGRISNTDAEQFLRSIAIVGVSFAEQSSFESVFSLAAQNSLTIYDAAYLDVAISSRLPMATLDKALRKAAGDVGVPIFEP